MRSVIFRTEQSSKTSIPGEQNESTDNTGGINNEDIRLLRDFFTGLGRLSGNDALIESGRTKEFDKLVQSLLKEDFYPILLSPAVLNPLLTKYKFDLKEFCMGVKDYAFPTINQYATTLTDANQHAEKYPKDSLIEITKELSSLMSDDEWKHFEKVLKDKSYESKFEYRHENTKISHINIFYLNTRIVGYYPIPEIHSFENNAFAESGLSVQETANVENNKSDDIYEVEDIYLHSFAAPKSKVRKSEDLRRYQKGSVVATIKCSLFCNMPEKINIKSPSNLVVETWTFEGCISGQTPLEWIVTEIKGPQQATIFQHFWYRILSFAGKFTLLGFGDQSN